jgi:hypothetical protein
MSVLRIGTLLGTLLGTLSGIVFVIDEARRSVPNDECLAKWAVSDGMAQFQEGGNAYYFIPGSA